MPISPRKKRKTFVNIIARKCREFVANFRSQTLKFKWNFFWIGKGVRICYHKNPLWTQIPKWYINPYQKSQFLALFWKKLWGKIFLIKKKRAAGYVVVPKWNQTKPDCQQTHWSSSCRQSVERSQSKWHNINRTLESVKSVNSESKSKVCWNCSKCSGMSKQVCKFRNSDKLKLILIFLGEWGCVG